MSIGTITYSAGASGWLGTWISGKAAPATIILTPSNTGLAAGTYTATVPIISGVATNSPQNVAVTYTLKPAPPPPVDGIEIALAGNIGSCPGGVPGELQRESAKAVAAATPDYVFVLGDNTHHQPEQRSTLADYQNCYEQLWGPFKSITYAAVGTHDRDTLGVNRGFSHGADAYFGPERVGPPGKNWYSFDIGSWHIIVLNVIWGGGDKAVVRYNNGSEQLAWLRDDLRANRDKKCTLAVWHDPMWISTNDTTKDGYRVQDIRGVWMALYDYGADVVVNGGYSIYERFAPMRYVGSYEDASGPEFAADPARGVRQFSSGLAGDGPTSTTSVKNRHPLSEHRSGGNGFLKLTLGDGGYSWAFLNTRYSRIEDRGNGTCHDEP